MTNSDKPQLTDIALSLGLLTRLPLPLNLAHSRTRGAAAAWAWPVAGAVVGTIAGCVGWLSMAVGLPASVAAGLTLATGPIMCGAMHEDGLADSADGLWGGWTRDPRLAIMKDSHIGTYGVIALILSFLLRWSALTTLFAFGHVFAAVFGAAVLSRLPMVALSWHLPQARPGGLSAQVGRPTGFTLAVAVFVTLILTIPSLGMAIVPALIVVATFTLIVARIASNKIGGQTGDILGAAQQICEVATLAALVALMT